METVITRCWCAWVVFSNPRKYSPTDGFGDVGATAFIPEFLLLEFDRLSFSIMTIDIVSLHINLSIYKSFCGTFRGWMTAALKGRRCLRVKMSVFLHTRTRSSLSVCINEPAVMFDHWVYHSGFQDLISKAGQSCPWEVRFAFFNRCFKRTEDIVLVRWHIYAIWTTNLGKSSSERGGGVCVKSRCNQ